MKALSTKAGYMVMIAICFVHCNCTQLALTFCSGAAAWALAKWWFVVRWGSKKQETGVVCYSIIWT